MSHYPDNHHPCFFLVDALKLLGADATFAKDERTAGCWGLIVNGRVVVWLIDNRWAWEKEKEDPAAEYLLSHGALVCCAQKPDAERIGAHWLPLAVTPGYHPPERSPAPLAAAHLVNQGQRVHRYYPATHTPALLADVCFVGYVRDATRASILTDVAAQFTLALGEGLFDKQALDLYHTAHCALNIPTNYYHPDAYDVNMRVFESLASGTPLITNHLDVLDEMGIQPNVHCLTYDSPDDIPACIRQLVHFIDEAKLMGSAAAKLAAERHTYHERAKQVLAWLQE